MVWNIFSNIFEFTSWILSNSQELFNNPPTHSFSIIFKLSFNTKWINYSLYYNIKLQKWSYLYYDVLHVLWFWKFGYFHNCLYCTGIRIGVSKMQEFLWMTIFIVIYIIVFVLSHFYENMYIKYCKINDVNNGAHIPQMVI